MIKRRAGFSPADLVGLVRWHQGDSVGTGAISAFPAAPGTSLTSGTATGAALAANGHKSARFNLTASPENLFELTGTDLSNASEFTLSATIELDYLTNVLAGKDNGVYVQHSAQIMYFQAIFGLYVNLPYNIGRTGIVRLLARFEGGGATPADRLRMWFDGEERAMVYPTAIPTSVALTPGFHMGQIPSVGSLSPGGVLDLHIYNRALSVLEIMKDQRWATQRFARRSYLAIGDSITDGHAITTPRLAWPNSLGNLPGVRSNGCDIRTCAVSGYTLAQLLGYAAVHGWPWLKDLRQTVRGVLIAGGTNDLGTVAAIVPTATALDRCAALATAARLNGATHVYVAVPLPRKDVGTMGCTVPEFDAKLVAYDAGLEIFLANGLIDGILRPGLLPSLADPDNPVTYQDKIHLTPVGSDDYAGYTLAAFGGAM